MAADAPLHARCGESLHVRILVQGSDFISPPAALETQRTQRVNNIFPFLLRGQKGKSIASFVKKSWCLFFAISGEK